MSSTAWDDSQADAPAVNLEDIIKQCVHDDDGDDLVTAPNPNNSSPNSAMKAYQQQQHNDSGYDVTALRSSADSTPAKTRSAKPMPVGPLSVSEIGDGGANINNSRFTVTTPPPDGMPTASYTTWMKGFTTPDHHHHDGRGGMHNNSDASPTSQASNGLTPAPFDPMGNQQHSPFTTNPSSHHGAYSMSPQQEQQPSSANSTPFAPFGADIHSTPQRHSGGLEALQQQASPMSVSSVSQSELHHLSQISIGSGAGNTHNTSVDNVDGPTTVTAEEGSENHGESGSGVENQLDQILQYRRELMAKMGDLATQEMELRHHHQQQQQQMLQQQQAAAAYGMMGVAGSPHHAMFMGGMGSPHMQLSPYAMPHHTLHAAKFQQQQQSQFSSIESIRGRIYEAAKDQHGCRYLQRLLDTQNYEGSEVSLMILQEVVPHIPELMTDQYANFLVQKLFDIMSRDVRYAVAQVTAPHFTIVALTAHGTFSVQKMIETIATREEMEIIKDSLMKDVLKLVKNVHGNHVIQKVLQRFDHPDKQFIYDALAADCVGISTNKQGCCVFQRSLEFASPTQRVELVTAVVTNSLLLVQDPYGNYVVQYVLETTDRETCDQIGQVFLPHLVLLSMNKFSSNVVEKVLKGCSTHIREYFFHQMMDQYVLLRLLQDEYGNYVVQTALSISTPTQAEDLVKVIRPLFHLIRSAPYAKKLESKMEMALKRKGLGMGPNFFEPTSTGTDSMLFSPFVQLSGVSSSEPSPMAGDSVRTPTRNLSAEFDEVGRKPAEEHSSVNTSSYSQQTGALPVDDMDGADLGLGRTPISPVGQQQNNGTSNSSSPGAPVSVGGMKVESAEDATPTQQQQQRPNRSGNHSHNVKGSSPGGHQQHQQQHQQQQQQQRSSGGHYPRNYSKPNTAGWTTQLQRKPRDRN